MTSPGISSHIPSAKPPRAVWTQAELQLFFKTARRVLQTQEFDVRIAPKMRVSARLLIVTPRKSGKAHVRNRFRRLIKEVARTLTLANLPYDWGIFARPTIHTLTFAELRTRFEHILKQLETRSSGGQ